MADAKKVKMDQTYTPDSTGRALYAGSVYELAPEVAKEVVDAKKGHYSKATSALTVDATEAPVGATSAPAGGKEK